ncbi:MAG: ATP-binding protein [Gammaproteobacteria bacterium]
MNISPDDPSFFERAFCALPTAALVVDRDGIVVARNDRALTLCPSENAQAKLHLSDIFSSDHNLIEEIRLTSARGKITLRTSVGSERERMAFVVSPLREMGQPPRHYMLIQDGTSRLGASFQSMNRKLREANERAAGERRMRSLIAADYSALESFSYAVAHDMKSPLRNISACMSILEEEGFGDRAVFDKRTAQARSAAERLQRLIDDLLTKAKATSVRIDAGHHSVSQIIDDACDSLYEQLRCVEGVVSVQKQTPPIYGDARLLELLFQNLIENALKYRSEDRPLAVTVSALDNGVRVADNGMGFDNRFAERIFEPFQRLHRRSEIPGSGVGLATCQTICTRHGWAIEATGKPGVGANFDIKFDTLR